MPWVYTTAVSQAHPLQIIQPFRHDLVFMHEISEEEYSMWEGQVRTEVEGWSRSLVTIDNGYGQPTRFVVTVVSNN
jgi:hypothetical protein